MVRHITQTIRKEFNQKKWTTGWHHHRAFLEPAEVPEHCPHRAPVPAQTVPMIWRFSTQLRPKPPSHQTPAPVTSCAYGLVGFHQIIFSRKLPSLLRQPQMIQSYFLRKGTFCLKLTPEHQEEIKDCILSHLNLLLCWTSSLDFMDSNSNISGARWGFTQHLYPTTKSRVPC